VAVDDHSSYLTRFTGSEARVSRSCAASPEPAGEIIAGVANHELQL
jgi:hypothetical protein